MWGTWGYWHSTTGEYVYSGGSTDRLTQWRLDADGRLVPQPVAQAPEAFDYPGAIPVVSSAGGAAGTGVVWTIDQTPGRATLRAFDAADIGQQIWSSATDPARDGLDSTSGFNHFDVPTIADGKVFVGGQDHLEVYGLSP
jgi:outer membrane protein assembly factor BamB